MRLGTPKSCVRTAAQNDPARSIARIFLRPRRSMQNSSPPLRPTTSISGTACARSSAAMRCNTTSPAACPRSSLMLLNRSVSTNHSEITVSQAPTRSCSVRRNARGVSTPVRLSKVASFRSASRSRARRCGSQAHATIRMTSSLFSNRLDEPDAPYHTPTTRCCEIIGTARAARSPGITPSAVRERRCASASRAARAGSARSVCGIRKVRKCSARVPFA